MTGGSLVSIKMILRKGVPTDVNGNLLGTSCAVVQYHIMHGIIDAKEHRCSQITTEVTIPEKKRFDACNSQMAHQFAANVSWVSFSRIFDSTFHCENNEKYTKIRIETNQISCSVSLWQNNGLQNGNTMTKVNLKLFFKCGFQLFFFFLFGSRPIPSNFIF